MPSRAGATWVRDVREVRSPLLTPAVATSRYPSRAPPAEDVFYDAHNAHDAFVRKDRTLFNALLLLRVEILRSMRVAGPLAALLNACGTQLRARAFEARCPTLSRRAYY
ncbi:hypothetical protein HYPSUDRAFT_208216 [Hypholoma sublateritium FD-334 SS-4]|uniref:Uncharacterized protein n=1 Tax=Hypholoma sublateritium (strain FD-334 SS-4) TaxID=945553 RepID=A0A0D2KK47_HYPSF|nr:hypothetical protein HYPSUDRAFT_208216 [Hypholoma sublateritium FD-334 SS-4]